MLLLVVPIALGLLGWASAFLPSPSHPASSSPLIRHVPDALARARPLHATVTEMDLSDKKTLGDAKFAEYKASVAEPMTIVNYCTSWEDNCKALTQAIDKTDLPDTHVLRLPVKNSLLIAKSKQARRRQTRMLNNMKQVRHHQNAIKIMLEQEISYGTGDVPTLQFIKKGSDDVVYEVNGATAAKLQAICEGSDAPAEVKAVLSKLAPVIAEEHQAIQEAKPKPKDYGYVYYNPKFRPAVR
ncbi:unnamed protein product [Vitrella brassicaformis CCMP3155]|uniref:Thioredoxin domain-containing protein n=1 Tax=Vitrella brassicaformis (strain CCMP3155) TaxID=1169540 RepID=A0A0G4EXD2_VITBC|nr:unnamed protein product [Vitrella brassicaformis CCMP3155]|eukprot:CEM03229.1 unnamed protein product [Vitrella brassicaformis CCMP3155]